jgi:hypothetical protein
VKRRSSAKLSFSAPGCGFELRMRVVGWRGLRAGVRGHLRRARDVDTLPAAEVAVPAGHRAHSQSTLIGGGTVVSVDTDVQAVKAPGKKKKTVNVLVLVVGNIRPASLRWKLEDATATGRAQLARAGWPT